MQQIRSLDRPVVTGICHLNNSRALHHRSLVTSLVTSLLTSLVTSLHHRSWNFNFMYLHIIYYFWNNNFYWMVEGKGIISFICDSFHSIDTWLFSISQWKLKIEEALCKRRESFDVFVSCILQPRLNDPLYLFAIHNTCGRH